MRPSLCACVAVLLTSGMALGQNSDANGLAARIHRDAIVVDGHNDVATWILDYGFDLGFDGSDPSKKNAELYWIVPWLLPTPSGDELRTHTDLRRLQAGGVDAQFFSIFPHPRFASKPGGTKQRALDMMAALNEQIRRHSNQLAMAGSASDVRRIVGEGKIAALMGLEGGHAIEGQPNNLAQFYRLGIRYMTLTWSNTNDWADSSSDVPLHGGLADLGRDVVREMNRLGMMVDVSHASDDTFWDVMAVTRAPIIASHSSVRALVENPRNMSDEMLRAVARNGGVVMVNFGGSFLDRRKAGTWKAVSDIVVHFGPSRVPLGSLLDHIDHVARVAGIDHVGLGSDFDGTMFLPEGLKDVSGFLKITAALVERGYSEAQIRKILGENTLRVLSEVAEVASQIQANRVVQGGDGSDAQRRRGGSP